jgi:hypothetical protein
VRNHASHTLDEWIRLKPLAFFIEVQTVYNGERSRSRWVNSAFLQSS